MSSSDITISVIPFQFNSQSVRVVMQDGEPWFVATDVCVALGILNPTDAIKRLDDDEVQVVDLLALDSIEGNKISNIANVVSEPGLYRLVLGSRKREAKVFKRWVAHDVLPSIRKTGKYEVAVRQPSKLELARDLVAALEREETERALRLQAEAAIEAAQPAVQFHDEVAYRPDTEFLIRVAAKTLLGGARGAEKKLVSWMLEHKWLTKTGGTREASAGAVRDGLMRQRIDVVNGYPYQVAVITGKGMCALRVAMRSGQLFTAAIPAASLMLPGTA